MQHWISQLDFSFLWRTLLIAVSSLLCITIHETCHGLAAYWLGDDTAKRAGRLSLNPLRHLDPVGLIAMVLVHFGWAKPVPINPGKFRASAAGHRADGFGRPGFQCASGLGGPVPTQLADRRGGLRKIFCCDGLFPLFSGIYCYIERGTGSVQYFPGFRRWTAPRCCFPSCRSRHTGGFCAMNGMVS